MIAWSSLICHRHCGLVRGGEDGKAGEMHVSLGSRAGITCHQAEVFSSFSVQDILVMIGVGAGTGLGLEIPADLHGVPWAWSKVGI